MAFRFDEFFKYTYFFLSLYKVVIKQYQFIYIFFCLHFVDFRMTCELCFQNFLFESLRLNSFQTNQTLSFMDVKKH